MSDPDPATSVGGDRAEEWSVGGWRIEERVGSAAALHDRWPAIVADPGMASVAVCRPERPAVVLGSTQPESTVDRARAAANGFVVARRRSGGGAVLVAEDDPIWIDLWVPAGHPRWQSDVARAFIWVGETWLATLGRLGIGGLSVHRGGSHPLTHWSSSVCFGGIGAGEVLTGDGRKVVGLSQRRTRFGAWFQTACVVRWDPGPLVGVLALGVEDSAAAVEELSGSVVGVAQLAERSERETVGSTAVVAAFIASLS
ncbi:MAG: lipoyl protein ligase domain-containing protein [Acidimicrobiales bacterium]